MITFTHYIISNTMTWKEIHTERKKIHMPSPLRQGRAPIFFYGFLIHVIKILADRLAHASDSERLRYYIQSVSRVTERKREMS